MRPAAALLLFLCAAAPVKAEEPALVPPPGARLPLDLPARDEAGRPTTLRDATGGRPIVLVFADYSCATLCGTALGLVAAALRETGLRLGEDVVLLVLGLDPRDGPAEATAMRRAHVGDGSGMAAASRFMTMDAPVLGVATASLGYHAVWRPDQARFDHPLAWLVLAPDGRLAEVLPALRFDPVALRRSVESAARTEPGAPGIVARTLAICRGFGALGSGARRMVVLAGLGLGGIVALAGLGGFVMLLRAQRRRAA
ncbi:hypothetical protein [Falsiroseomonas sp. HW251]|uniref:hypothetical protein n=1 Tax=Falsiroseomonas sp. HW251 TaxID=3390998 RepID=UPI003D311DDA